MSVPWKREETHFPNEWLNFPSSGYAAKFDPKCDNVIINLTPGSNNVEDWVNEQTKYYVENGMRYLASAVIICHQNLHPCLLMLEKTQFHDQTVTDEVEGELVSDRERRCLDLPTFQYKRWESPTDILQKKLNRLIRFKGGDVIEGLESLFLPYLSHQEISMSQTTSSVDVIPEVSDITTKQSIFQNSDSIPEDDENHLHDESIADSICPSEKSETLNNNISNGKQLVDGVNGYQKFIPQPTISRPLGIWWITEFGIPPLPHLPAHITRPKCQIKLYQVIIPPECEFVLPTSNISLRFISFEDILSNQIKLGPGYLSLPQIICQVPLHSVIPKPIDSQTPSRLINRLDSKNERKSNDSENHQNLIDSSNQQQTFSHQQDFISTLLQLEEETDESETTSLG